MILVMDYMKGCYDSAVNEKLLILITHTHEWRNVYVCASYS